MVADNNNRLVIMLKIGCILAISTGVGLAFELVGLSEINIIVIYIVGVIAIASWTEGKVHSLIYSILAVVAFNFFFVVPRFSFLFEPNYITTFLVMFLVALLISTITTKLKEETAERRMIEERARHEELRSNLLRSISHDLRTPLTGISGSASLLLDKGDYLTEEKKIALYHSIHDDAEWLNNLVENLLAITRVGDIEGGEINLNLQVELVADIVDEAIRHCDKRLADHKLVIEHEDEFLLAKMDARLVTQVIINLVNNAVKYTEEGSVIRVHTSKRDNEAVLCVSDNGPGIRDADQEKLFERFYVANPGEGDNRRGLGLGLALCKSVAEAHGGTITVMDNKPRGAAFEVTLPLVEVEHE